MPFEFESPALIGLLLIVPAILFLLRYTLLDSSKLVLGISTAIRVGVIVLLVLALASSLWVRRSTDLAVLVLSDLSGSVAQSAQDQLKDAWTDIASHEARPDMMGLGLFAAEAQLAAPVDATRAFPGSLTLPEEQGATSIEAALRLARQVMPAGAVKRVVLLSDGNETSGDALAAAKRAAARGIQIYTFPYEAEERDEILLEDLTVPPEVKKGQTFSITAVAHSSLETTANFTLFRNGFKINEQEIELKKGANTVAFEEPEPTDGLTKYELRLTTESDFYVDNNVASGIVYVSGEPRILLLEGQEREARYLARALGAENMRVEVRAGRGMPTSLEELTAFDAVIVSDVPATDLSVQQMELLRSYVEDLGGGFIMIGGENSFGLGGYYQTPVEDALPVRMRSEKKKDTPSLAMMLVIDKSGSMQGEKIDLAKEAAIATVELLTDKDYLGVVAFDGAAYWAVELQTVTDQDGIIQTLEMIEAGGGTSIYPALEQAYDALLQVPATFKHTVLLTDGQSQPGDFAGVVDMMVAGLITVSSVAIGEGADGALLQDIARWGRGRYYFTNDPYDIPQIFTKETMTASKSTLIEEPYLPQVFRTNQVIQSIDWEASPFLFGYVVTEPKATADVPLVTERGDPLLASWQFGLGRAVAFTSDAKSKWGADWLNWPDYGRFWAQVIRDTMRTTQSRGNETRIVSVGSQCSITIDNIDESGRFVNGLKTTVQIVKPSLELENITLEQTAPGRYEAEFPMEETGSYLFQIRQTTQDGGEENAYSDYTRGYTISYQPEYRHLTTNEDFLRELAEITGGGFNTPLDEILRVEAADAVPSRKPLWPNLLAAALILFIFDVAIRRFDLAGWGLPGTEKRYG